jgi:uncharacterized membrane protein
MVPRFIHAHIGWRFLVASIAGGLTAVAPIPGLVPALRGILGWIVGVVIFLALTRIAVGDGSPAHLRERVRSFDESVGVISALIMGAAAISLVALGYAGHMAAQTPALRLGLCGIAVILSWVLIHILFAAHYAHAFYGEPGPKSALAERGGLDFPGKLPPDYWDFVYYSMVVGMTCQVSDVQITSREMRRLTIIHGILSFYFNTGVLALAVNVIAGAI